MSEILNMLNDLQAQTGKRQVVHPGADGKALPSENIMLVGGAIADFFDLKENPFADSLNLNYYYKTSSQKRAYLKMRSTVEDGISLGLVTGPSGSGKSIITQLLLETLPSESYGTIMVLVSPRMSKTVLLKEMLRELGVDSGTANTRGLLDLLHRVVFELHEQGMKLVTLIDEAHFLSSEALHMLRTISNLEVPTEKLATCLLFAEDHFLRRLRHPSYHSLSTRMYHRARLETMSEEETSQYISFRLMVAGGSGAIIDKEARRAIYERSGGICREVNRLCYLGMVEGQLKGRSVVTVDLVEGIEE